MTESLPAALFLLAVGLAPLVGAVAAMARMPLTPVQSGLYFAAWVLVRVLWRCQLPARLPLPEGQGAVIVSNHRSSVDPFFVEVSTRRKVHWLVAREFYENLAFRWFLRQCEVIPVGRGGVDAAATKTAIRIVAGGGLVGMFPEGRINMTEELLLPGRPGAALVALKAGAPIVPCYIADAPYDRFPWSPLLMPARVELRYGEPLDLTEFVGREHEDGVLEEVLLRSMRAIAALAGQSDFAPRLAGRQWKPSREQIAADQAAARQRKRKSG